MKKFFKNWTFSKHLGFVSAIYAISYAIDLTVGYLLMKKISKNLDSPKRLWNK